MAVYAHSLREGDEIKAADAKTWLDPVRRVQFEQTGRYGASRKALVWTSTRPGYGSADFVTHEHHRLRIRRAIR